MSLAIRLQVEPVRSLAFGGISGVYAGIGTAMTRPIRMILLQNLTDQTVMISFDGVEDHFPLAASGYIVLDITANKTIDTGFFLAEGQRFYVKDLGAACTSESVYVTVFYGSE